ncbi:MAG: excinuclease ABC subunit UvrC [Rhodothermales bacterium]
MSPDLKEKLDNLPRRPGVYQHIDADGKLLYVGKAKDLRSRVRSYFQEGRPKDGRLNIMIRKIADFEVIVTDTEAEALILENTLIKKLKPRYNVNLRDDKSYPYICIVNERFPRVFPTRRVRKDGSRYFGPYTDVKNMRLMLRTIRSIFKLRTCSLNLSEAAIAAGKYQPCLEYHIKKCAAPCVNWQSEESYNQTIAQVEKLLNGHTQELIGLLQDEMRRVATEMKFEEAAELRDQITALEKYSSKQKVVSQEHMDRDIFALAVDREEAVACGVIFKVREGKVIGRQHKYLRRIEGIADAELMQSFLDDYYADAVFFPEEVLLSRHLEDPEPLEQLLHRGRGKKVPLRVPQRGDKAGLIRMVEANAELLVEEWKLQRERRGEDRIPFSVKKLQKDLRLAHLPRRIECFDISHLGGTATVGSCVVFEDGQPRKSEYRHFKVRTLEEGKPDDYQSMREVISRRYKRIAAEDGPWPDLLVVDGGKGQLSSAVTALREIGVYGRFPVVGLAKRLEEVFYPGDTESLLIARDSASLKLLQRIRNEAHRFAITFQRKQRSQHIRTELTSIPGIGPAISRKLLSHFGSVKRIRGAAIEELEEVIGSARAAAVQAYFEGNTNV